MSCDAYFDVWEGFSVCLKEYWPDCPYPVYLAAENISAPSTLVFKKTLFSKAESWSARLIDSLAQLPQSRVLFVLDDMWLSRPIDSEKVLKATECLENSDIGVVRLTEDSVTKTAYPENPDYQEILFGEPYRVSTAPSIWKKDFLLSVLSASESAWEFERVGSFRETGKSHRVLCVKQPIYHILGATGAVERGKYERFTSEFAKAHGITIDFTKRAEKTRRDVLLKSLKSFIYNLSPKGIVKLQNALYDLTHR